MAKWKSFSLLMMRTWWGKSGFLTGRLLWVLGWLGSWVMGREAVAQSWVCSRSSRPSSTPARSRSDRVRRRFSDGPVTPRLLFRAIPNCNRLTSPQASVIQPVYDADLIMIA